MEEPYKVTICIPVYGVEKFIERCAISLFEQTYQNIEYVFVNDATKDNSIHILHNVCEKYITRKSNVVVINHDVNYGLAEARNTAISAATGEFIVHVDSDDYIEKDAIRILVQKQVETSADVVNMDYYLHKGNRCKKIITKKYKDVEKYTLETIKRKANIVIWGRLIRKSLYVDNSIKTIAGYNMGEDWQVIPRIFYFTKKIEKVDYAGYHYLYTDGGYTSSFSSSFSSDKGRQVLASYRCLEKFFSSKEIEYRDALKEAHAKIIGELLLSCYKSNCYNDFFDELCIEKKLIDKELYKKIEIKLKPFFIFFNKNLLHIYASIGGMLFKLLKFLK